MGNAIDVQAQIDRKPRAAQLLHAAETGDEQKLKSLLEDLSEQVDYANSSALTPLFLAAKEGYTECVRTLLEAGARVDGIGEGNSVLTPIWVATYAGHGECVRYLIEAGANLNVKFPQTPLYIAAREGRTECLRLLIAAGSDIEVRNVYRQTPLHCACSELHVNCVELLVNAGSNVNVRDKMGHTPMYFACGASADDGNPVVQLLLASGASINQPCDSQTGSTPLHMSAEKGKIKNRWLLMYGANVLAKDKSDQTPRERAVGYPECEELLKQFEGCISSLQEQCAWRIRNYLGHKRLQCITDLPVPKALQRYILFDR